MKASSATTKILDGRSKKRPGLNEHRCAIIDAAVELFSQQGSQAVSISQICSLANLSRPTFYRCFKDKEALIHALYQESVNQPVEEIMLRGLAEREVDEDWIKVALEQLFDAIFDNARLAELVFMESNNPASPAYAIVDNAFEHFADAMETSIAKTSRHKPSRVFLKSLMAACQWIVHDAIRTGLDESTREEAKAAAWQLTQGARFSFVADSRSRPPLSN